MTDLTLYYAWLNGELELPFQLYLVGGAVRDQLLGRTPKDFDFVAVGATQAQFVKAFPSAQLVGNSFPVYLVPGLGEVAFARLERKLGLHHTDFEVLFDPHVTLEQDLQRRDLTINAIAMRHDGSLVDPFGGASDLQRCVLQHVGPAFSEDALRVFRLARFASQLDFVISTDTMRVAREVPREDLLALPAERVCEEFRKALRSANPCRFIEELERMGALELFFPELAHLRFVPAGPQKWHPEGDALTHSLMVLDYAVTKTYATPEREDIRLAALFHDLGKGVTPPEKWPQHTGHDEAGVPLVEAACDRLKLPTALKLAAVCACREHMRVHVFLDMRKGKMVDMIQAADRCTLKAEGLAVVCCSDHFGRGTDADPVRLAATGPDALRSVAPACRAEKGHPIPANLQGPKIGEWVRKRKSAAVRQALIEAGFMKAQVLPQKDRRQCKCVHGFPAHKEGPCVVKGCGCQAFDLM